MRFQSVGRRRIKPRPWRPTTRRRKRLAVTQLPLSVEESFSARVPRSSAEERRVFIHDIKEVEDVGQQEQQGDKREDEEGDEVKGEDEEIRNNAHSAHET